MISQSLAIRAGEVSRKLEMVRSVLRHEAVLRLRGTDWFAWMTAGASNTVLLTAEVGIAEVLVTSSEAWVLTDEIEAQRLVDEELPPGFEVHSGPWAVTEERERFVREKAGSLTVLSDRPHAWESRLPDQLLHAKRRLVPSEIERYRIVGRHAAEAMTAVLEAAEPAWTEYQLAGAGAQALWSRGLHPALTLAAGDTRLFRYRHPTPNAASLGRIAMLVFCARGFGLYANLTRFVNFGPLSAEDRELHEQVRRVEAEALAVNRPGARLDAVYHALETAYATLGHRRAIFEHHQGGTTGYLSREIVATPETKEILEAPCAVAWNPSVRGAKIEDTFLVTDQGLENLTLDVRWPTEEVAGLARPLVLERQ